MRTFWSSTLLVIVLLVSGCAAAEGSRPPKVSEEIWNDLTERAILHNESIINEDHYAAPAEKEKMNRIVERNSEISKKHSDMIANKQLNKKEKELVYFVSTMQLPASPIVYNKAGIKKISEEELNKAQKEYSENYNKLKKYFGITDEKSQEVLSGLN